MNITLSDVSIEEFIKIAKALGKVEPEVTKIEPVVDKTTEVAPVKVPGKSSNRYTEEERRAMALESTKIPMTEVAKKYNANIKTVMRYRNMYAPKKEEPVLIDDSKMLTRSEISKLFNVTDSNIWYWESKGMPVHSVNGVKKYDADEVKAWRKTHVRPQNKKAKVVAEKSDFTTWQRKMFDIIDSKKLDRGKTCSAVFRKMNTVYGVVWDQVKKDFYNANGYSSKSTMQLCYWLQTSNPAYRELFDCILEGMVAAA